MIIRNKQELATTELRTQALEIIEVGIERVLPEVLMRSSVSYDHSNRILTVNGHNYDVSKGRIFVIGGGKASGLMAKTIEDIVGVNNIMAGVVTCKSGSNNFETRKIKMVPAGHPIPDQRGVNGIHEMLHLKTAYSINENDLLLCLISGGGSALMPCPADGINLKDKQYVTELLLSSGADIYEINTVRKHLSQTKGGRLGNCYSPASVVSLILSDVIGNDLSIIASGPTYPDSSTFSDACSVLEKYKLLFRLPGRIADFLRKGSRGLLEETPETLENSHNHIIGDNTLALEAMAQKARNMGFAPHIVTAEQKGETSTVARFRANEILSGKYAKCNALLIGGETTPTLPAYAGKGGRNQHYAAISMLAMARYPGEWLVASVGTDGSDFLPGVAGAIVDQNSFDIAQAKEIDVKSYVERYDSNTLLNSIGSSLIITGDTGTNVGDVNIYLTS
ncbi:glycerate kinase [Chloroflexota bacterium]